jgi:Protein of unknown function (DUF1036)
VRGWWNVNPFTCLKFNPPFPKGPIYFYAETGGALHWGGNDATLCVQNPGPWESPIPDGSYSCQANERAVGFGRIEVNGDQYKLTLNP